MDDMKKEMEKLGIDYEEKDVIKLNNDMEADVIFETGTKKYKKFLIIIPMSILLLLCLFSTIILSQNKIVFNKIVDANYNFGNISIISNSYSVTTNDMKIGSNIMYTDSNDNQSSPFVTSYKTGIVKQISGMILYIKIPTSQDLLQVPIFHVLYITS